jgi:hypothetical protein
MRNFVGPGGGESLSWNKEQASENKNKKRYSRHSIYQICNQVDRPGHTPSFISQSSARNEKPLNKSYRPTNKKKSDA